MGEWSMGGMLGGCVVDAWWMVKDAWGRLGMVEGSWRLGDVDWWRMGKGEVNFGEGWVRYGRGMDGDGEIWVGGG